MYFASVALGRPTRGARSTRGGRFASRDFFLAHGRALRRFTIQLCRLARRPAFVGHCRDLHLPEQRILGETDPRTRLERARRLDALAVDARATGLDPFRSD